jgi:radical SAM superfamily enzyme YgiQ (UPF0313 family)
MKRLLLISANHTASPYPVPPVGVCLQTVALADIVETLVFDALARDPAELPEVVTTFKPDYIGIGIRNIDDVVMANGEFFIDEIRDTIAAPLREISSVPLILGGSGFTLFPEDLLETMDADYGVVGEAEHALPALLIALNQGDNPSSIPGVICRHHLSAFQPTTHFADPDQLPFSEVDVQLDYTPYRQRGAYPIQTKRGCSRRCLYCSYPLLEGTVYRCRSPRSVVDEIEQAKERLGAVTFEFVDSTFNDPPGHAEAICEELIRRKPGATLRTMGVNPAGVTRNLIDLMQQAGFAQIDCTPDSASPTMIANLRKGFTRRTLEEAAEAIREADMPTMWFFLLGGPGESETTLSETFDFVDRHIKENDMVHISEGLRIYPKTGLHDEAIRLGVLEPSESLLKPRFFVSPILGRARLEEVVSEALATRPNCVRSTETNPPNAMLEAAIRQRRERSLTEPMFRTLLRLRRNGWNAPDEGNQAP